MRPKLIHSICRMSLCVAFLVSLAACAGAPLPEPAALLAPTEQQLKLRNLQSRTFDVAGRKRTMTAVIATLQDLGFIIERANEPLGVVTAARFAETRFYDVIGVTVTVREVGETQTTVRVNAIFNSKPVDDPEVYRNFFASFERALFIDRN